MNFILDSNSPTPSSSQSVNNSTAKTSTVSPLPISQVWSIENETTASVSPSTKAAPVKKRVNPLFVGPVEEDFDLEDP